MRNPTLEQLATEGDSYRMAGSNGIPVTLVILPNGDTWAVISTRLNGEGEIVVAENMQVRPVYVADWDGAPGDGIWYYMDALDNGRPVTLH